MKTNSLLEALTKRELQRQMQDRGLTRSQALRILKGMPHAVRWKRLSLKTRLQILWKCRNESTAA